MNQYGCKFGEETAVPVYKRRTVANINKARSALLRAMYALDEVNLALDQEGDHVSSKKGRDIVVQIGQLREGIKDRGTY